MHAAAMIAIIGDAHAHTCITCYTLAVQFGLQCM